MWSAAGSILYFAFRQTACRATPHDERSYHPQGRGKNERFHRTLKAEVLDLAVLAGPAPRPIAGAGLPQRRDCPACRRDQRLHQLQRQAMARARCPQGRTPRHSPTRWPPRRLLRCNAARKNRPRRREVTVSYVSGLLYTRPEDSWLHLPPVWVDCLACFCNDQVERPRSTR